MTDREIVEWVAQVQDGEPVPSAMGWARIAYAMHDETGLRLPYTGESWTAWCALAKPHARRVVESETWRADALK